jgi:hypothetical protein
MKLKMVPGAYLMVAAPDSLFGKQQVDDVVEDRLDLGAEM